MINVKLTIQNFNKNAFINSLNHHELKLTLIPSVDSQDLSGMEIKGFNSTADIRFISMIQHLREQRIPFSLEWRTEDMAQGGECHFRITPTDEQYLSWNDGQKMVVNIENVREAILEGEIRLFEFLDTAERSFIPWEWADRAA